MGIKVPRQITLKKSGEVYTLLGHADKKVDRNLKVIEVDIFTNFTSSKLFVTDQFFRNQK